MPLSIPPIGPFLNPIGPTGPNGPSWKLRARRSRELSIGSWLARIISSMYGERAREISPFASVRKRIEITKIVKQIVIRKRVIENNHGKPMKLLIELKQSKAVLLINQMI